MDSAILYAGPLAREAAVEISFAPPGKAVHLLGDADQLRIALNNLLRNAIEALAECDPKKPRRICVDKDHIELVVGDSGPGLGLLSSKPLWKTTAAKSHSATPPRAPSGASGS